MGRLFWRAMVAAGIAAAVAVGGAFAQISISPPPGGGSVASEPAPATQNAGGGSPATSASPGDNSATQPTAEGVLEALLREKANQGQGGAGISGPVAEKNGLLREGELIEMRSGRLIRADASASTGAPTAATTQPSAPAAADAKTSAAEHAGNPGTGMFFVFDHHEGQPDYPPMEIVPSRRLAIMEDASDNGTRPVNFRITAEVTEYRGKNYLYVKPSAGGPLPLAPATATAPASAPASAPAAPVLQEQLPAVAPDEPTVPRVREEETVEGRLGRLVRDERSGLEVYEFDADRQKMDDPPMGVIPCKALEVMEDATEDGTRPVKFRLSGEVTQYRGKNYLYVRAFSVVKNLQQGIGG